MDTQSYEQELLVHAKRQTAALEKLVQYAVWWTLIPVLALVVLGIWLFVTSN